MLYISIFFFSTKTKKIEVNIYKKKFRARSSCEIVNYVIIRRTLGVGVSLWFSVGRSAETSVCRRQTAGGGRLSVHRRGRAAVSGYYECISPSLL